MKKLWLLILLFSALMARIQSQSLNLSISQKADSLNESFIKKTPDSKDVLDLALEYYKNGEYELAMIEAFDVRNSVGYFNPKIEKLAGETSFFLNKAEVAHSILTNAYLLEPDDDILLKIAILEHTFSRKSQAKFIFNRLKERNFDLFPKLKNVLSQFIDGSSLIPQTLLNIVQEIDASNYEKYFVKPSISISSPADNSYTKENNAVVKFGVKHNKPIKTLTFGSKELFKRNDDRYTGEKEEFSADFSEKIELLSGLNRININVVDIFGMETQSILSLFSDQFPSKLSLSGEYADSMKNAVAVLNSYISLKNFPRDDFNVYNLYVFDAKSDLRSVPFISGIFGASEYYEQGDKNVRFVNEINVSDENISYLLKNFKFDEPKSTLNLLISGKWNRTNDDFQVIFYNKVISLLKICESLKSIKTEGINLILEGYEKEKSDLISFLVEACKGFASPVSFSITGKRFQESLFQALTNPATSLDSVFSPIFSLAEVTKFDKDFSYVTCPPNLTPPFCKNVFAMGRIIHQAVYAKLIAYCTEKKIPAKQSAKILEFCKNWRVFDEMTRFINGTLSADKFIVRIDEYFSRKPEGGVK